MKHILLTVGLALALFPPPMAAAKQKMLTWETGILLDSAWGSRYAGTVGGGSQNGTITSYGNTAQYHGYSSGSGVAVYRISETFVIQGSTHIYIAVQPVRWRWSRAANLTVNGPVRFAVDGRRLYVADEDNRVYEMAISKKILRLN